MDERLAGRRNALPDAPSALTAGLPAQDYVRFSADIDANRHRQIHPEHKTRLSVLGKVVSAGERNRRESRGGTGAASDTSPHDSIS